MNVCPLLLTKALLRAEGRPVVRGQPKPSPRAALEQEGMRQHRLRMARYRREDQERAAALGLQMARSFL